MNYEIFIEFISCFINYRLRIKTFKSISYSPHVFITETNSQDEEPNVLLEFCFPDIYGPNFGFSTLIEFEEECIVGEGCSDTGESIDPDEKESSLDNIAGTFYGWCSNSIQKNYI